ncbi:hypothetical protein MB901379_03118 [Mycobacterium basiliense]|uniref:Uncharacterized protein n=1 Tax=Mycobacterium basiliense TaxID=2094119 RepID=A0A3S4FP19_9MYCO|nr:hypothetical protein [Mycobacterium basiliense]VDM89541.1 hypothetical protein MB901379_03118 [Mycobacterium basiliense]
MAKPMWLLIRVGACCVGVAACASQPHPSASSTSSSAMAASTSTADATDTSAGTAVTSAPCVGSSICPPPPPDAQGNPACFYSDGWQATSSGAGIEVWYFHDPQDIPKPDKVTAVVQKVDGTNESQEAIIQAGQQVHRFEFPGIERSAVSEVFLDTGNGRCFVIGPGS